MIEETAQDPTAKLELEAEHLLFQPPPDSRSSHDSRLLHNNLRCIPRYLFRLATPDSGGITDGIWANSKSAFRRRPDYFAREDPEQAAEEIKKHLLWEPQDNDNLVSWTSSLLSVLQFAYYANAPSGRKDKHFKHNADSIRVWILDTWLFEPGTFIQDMDLIESFKEHSSRGRSSMDLSELLCLRTGTKKSFLRHPHPIYLGEYLSQGSLKIRHKSASVTLKDLMECSLSILRPDLGCSTADKDHEVTARQVIDLRKCFSHGHVPLNRESTKAVSDITELFDPIWRVPWAANLLALQPRSIYDALLKECLADLKITGKQHAPCMLTIY